MQARRDPALAVLEGLHALKHALRFGARILDAAAADPPGVAAAAAELAPDVASAVEAVVRRVPTDAFRAMAPRPHPTGVIALARRPKAAAADVLDLPGPEPVLLLDRPRHHGNIGAAIRVAAAAGAGGVLVTGEHDPWDPAALRGAAGLHFALPVLRLSESETAAVLGCGRPVVAIHPGGEPLRRRLLPARAILTFGSERHGLRPTILDGAAHVVGIPMRQGVSSLNLATAVAVVLYARPTQ